MSDNKRTVTYTGGLCLPLTVIFVALKVSGQVDWSWLWVLAPMWAPLALVLGFAFCTIAVVGLGFLATFPRLRHSANELQLFGSG